MTGRHDGDQLTPGEFVFAHALGPKARQDPGERDVERALAHLLGEFLTPAAPQHDVGLGQPAAAGVQFGRDADRGHRGDRSDGEPSADLARVHRLLRAGGFGRVECLPRPGEERGAGGGRPYLAAGALEEPDTQLLLSSRAT